MIKYSIAYVPGTWDLFHYGHVRLLRKAKAIARVVVAGVNTDESVMHGKGSVPVMNLKERFEVVASCKYVDAAIVNEMNIPYKRLRKMCVTVIVLGSDWKGKSLDGLNEAKQTMKIVYYKYTNGVSSSEIKKAIVKDKL